MRSLLISILIGTSLFAGAAPQPSLPISATLLSTGESIQIGSNLEKGLVLVFISGKCPCSISHMKELASLAKDYPHFRFVGVHSNADETAEAYKVFFERSDLGFPVIQDEGAKIADQFKAFKTPHAYVLGPKGEVLYQGGVSNSHNFPDASEKYLRQALSEIEAGKSVQTPQTRTLGCVISRGEKHVWK